MLSHLTSHGIRISCRFRVRFYGRAFFFILKDNPPHGPRPSSLALRFFLFLLHCIGPVWAPLAFRRAFLHPSPAMLSRSLVFSALLSYLSYSQTSDVRTHSPTHHLAARKGVWSKGSWLRARCFVLFYLFYFVLFFLLKPCFISPHFAEGSDSGAWNGLAMGAARSVFSLLLDRSGFLGCVCSEAVRAGSV